MLVKKMVRNKNNQEEVNISEDAASIDHTSFPIIGIGASAGGLEAFEQFFSHLPADSGMGFILVPHLDPGHASMLTEILQRVTPMPVIEAKDQMAVEPNHVYVIPPNRNMGIFHWVLQLSAPEEPRRLRLPIDFFLCSLAQDQEERAIGIILSGTGTDGTLGLRAILGAGGVSFVQEPATAKYDGMPASAVKNGLAMFVLPVEKMPEHLILYVKTLIDRKVKLIPQAPIETSALNKVLMILRSRTGHDFSQYKKSTISRRIERRMIVHGIEKIATYARYLNEHPDEVTLLFKELHIKVTSFFRDKEAFEVLNMEILPLLFKNKPENYVFRIWTAGCATGEEAYSIAILFREYMDGSGQEFKVQIYATDIDYDAIAEARAGSYPPNIAIDVSPERLRRFFITNESGFRIKKDIREMVVFTLQNVIKDPPFTKLDMVSCRNLLIYFEPELQKRIIPVFHYALKPGGMLFLGNSENIGSHDVLFKPINKKWNFFETKFSLSPVRPMITGGFHMTNDKIVKEHGELFKKEISIAELTKHVLLQSYAPASVVTNEKGEILFVYGETGKFLRPAPGNASLNIVEMARDGLKSELRNAIHNATAQKKLMVCKDLLVRTNGESHGMNLTVRPLTVPGAASGVLLVCFHEIKPEGKRTRVRKTVRDGQQGRVEELEQELLYAKENLHATIEELQASNEELKSTNEEIQSTNEELQSTNEELESSKEELQSVNEELVTVNAELHEKIEELTGIENDMKNLLDNIHIGMIFLDKNLTIKRFTQGATSVFRMAASDAGRSLGDIKSNIEGDDLIADVYAVLDSFTPREKIMQTMDKEWYLVRIMLYRTLYNVIEGIVLTFTNVTELRQSRQAEIESRLALEYAESILDTVWEPLVVLDGALNVVYASRSFYEYFKVSPQETVGCLIYDLGNRQWDTPRLRELLETILPKEKSFENIEIDYYPPVIGRRKTRLNARYLHGKTGKPQFILLAIEDVTDRKPEEQIGSQEKRND